MNLKIYIRFFPMLLCLLGLGITQQAKAQITAIDASAYAYSGSYCATPANAEISVFGVVSGSISVYDSLTVTFFFGDGADTTFKVPAGMGGGTIMDSFGTGLVHTYALAGVYTPMITLSAASGVTDTAYATTLTFTNTCANISGNLYADADGDCNYDSGETLLDGMFVKATNTTTGSVYYSSYSTTGAYTLNVPSGFTYTLTTGSWWTGMAPSCPAGGSATLTVSGTGALTQDFGFSCDGSDPDLSVYATSSGFRPGFVRGLYVYGFSNEFCVGTPATISLTLPALTSYSTTWWGAAPTVSGSTLTWNVADISGLDNFVAAIGVYADPSAAIGDSACITVTITPVGTTDADMSNNTYNVCIPFTNSFDPNEKLVAPRGMGDDGLIPVTTSTLTYQVNFQNTGNDTAYTVTIRDVLDNALDPASVHILGGSHPFTAGITNGKELQFRFDDIMLPDSNVNEPASHGYVLYQVRLKPSIASGAVIHNTADIYFDYNDAIVTNTTVNTLYLPTSVQQVQNGNLKASVYPNPAADKVMVQVENQWPFTATLRDITGRVVLQASGTGTMQLNTRPLPNGIYQLSIQSNQAAVQTKVVLQR